MPPHCDAIDGPVVKAAGRALNAEDVDLILPYVQVEDEDEVRMAFERAVAARRVTEAREVVDRYFFETVVRVHRAGEGAPYTGLKPAGLDVGPVIPLAEQAIDTGSSQELLQLLEDALREEMKHRFEEVMALQKGATGPVPQGRAYVEAMLGLQVWSHKLYAAIKAPAHG